MSKNNKKPDKPECKGHWKLIIKIIVGLVSPFLPDILDFLMKLFQS
ncbi:MAG: hypothetical protein OXU51_06465 [Candidatus Poribacteria bacterium]|nr:hypothetical protein [Candidatus Poribacteria bacterium]